MAPDILTAVGIAILLLVLVGWRPRLTAIPHAWVAFSFYNEATLVQGGEQAQVVLTLLLLPIALTDRRRWHWVAVEGLVGGEWSRTIAAVGLALVRLQVAIIYLDSSLSKLAVPEWSDGTAMYYWWLDSRFGLPLWMRPLLLPILKSPLVVAVTWPPLVLEFFLGVAWLLPWSRRKILLVLGVLFHAAIGLTMGIPAFGLTMIGALVVYLVPPEAAFPGIAWVREFVAKGSQGRVAVLPEPVRVAAGASEASAVTAVGQVSGAAAIHQD